MEGYKCLRAKTIYNFYYYRITGTRVLAMVLKVSQRGEVSPFIVMDVLRSGNRLQAQGKEVFHLELGQPSTPAPKNVINAALKAANEDPIGYTEALG